MAYRIGQIRERTGLSERQLRSWERSGLVSPRRGSGEQRSYDENDLQVLQRAKRLREAGLSLAEIRRVLNVERNSSLGVEADAIRELRSVLARAQLQLTIADELAGALHTRVARRHGRPSSQMKADRYVRRR